MMKLGFFLYGPGHHIAAWRDPATVADSSGSLRHYIEITQAAERAKFDFVFNADSNSVIVKGLISMLIRVLSGRTPDEIIAAKLEFINEIGMRSHLAQTRSNGLLSMVKQMKNYALAYKIKNTAKV